MTDLPEPNRPASPSQAYDARQPLIVFDGVCVFCSGFVQLILRLDREKRFRFATAQSPLGEALFRRHGLPTDDYDSNLAIIDGAAFTKLDSFVAVMAALGWPWRATKALLILPRPLRDWLYDRVARNRYALFGRKDSCEIPSAELRERLIG
ncbi:MULTISPECIES: thiol-disulfide oxidoreductase DCC family protein [unclassified Mesorhizobium]|uniref:thiol-disulfide oxidoreductase DCC family protein n=1 Tax=unclassified Mesorhizobium TaxID=325217 RepID=UPI000FD75D8B|nr:MULTISPECIES: thiol-disulfide oxidoreductase DCC family protein [unclassified Mesorhizobium]TGT73829.1 thiol-disulfide oxidoreductase DCC family protein [Mesorhizobium sp. M2E.F.Ca.ET.166.01.1.1]TGW00343.1 thiol-disulfide oxidoreductase DCC family protein [Mesorhizobium sp. M2E.F.Ca.ET.154.01.1.1]